MSEETEKKGIMDLIFTEERNNPKRETMHPQCGEIIVLEVVL